METPMKMDDLGVPLFLETPIYETLWEKCGYSPAQVKFFQISSINSTKKTYNGSSKDQIWWVFNLKLQEFDTRHELDHSS